VTGLEIGLVFGAAVAAGAINAVVGSGTLITFAALLAVGIPPTTANVSNSVGLVPGALSAAGGYRRELTGQRARLQRLGSASLLGGVAGAALLLVLPDRAFNAIVPALVAVAVALIALQSRITSWLQRQSPGRPHVDGHALWVLLMAVLGLSAESSMQRNNAAKNALSVLVRRGGLGVHRGCRGASWCRRRVRRRSTTFSPRPACRHHPHGPHRLGPPRAEMKTPHACLRTRFIASRSPRCSVPLGRALRVSTSSNSASSRTFTFAWYPQIAEIAIEETRPRHSLCSWRSLEAAASGQNGKTPRRGRREVWRASVSGRERWTLPA
jgi:hypothetical protein